MHFGTVTPLTALVVDGDLEARETVVELLASTEGVRFIGQCGNSREAIRTILAERPDVVFMNVELLEMDAFTLLGAIRGDYIPHVILMAPDDSHARRAFDIRATDYLVKPLSKTRFDEAIGRLKAAVNPNWNLNSYDVRESNGTHPHARRIPLKTNGRIVIVSTDDIEWIGAERDYVRVSVGSENHLVRGTMISVEAALPADRFVRIHRSTIVNLEHVAELKPAPSGDYVVKTKSGSELTLSRTYRGMLTRLMPALQLR